MPQVVFAGTAGGGVWRSTDSGHSWTPLSDQEPTLTVGALALDPKNDNTLYVGTGDNWLGFGSLPGEGIRVTHDAMAASPHWGWLTDPTTHAINFAGQRVMNIVIDAESSRIANLPSNVIAATERGIWQSGDGGQTWTLRVGNVGTQKGTSFPQPRIGWVVAQPPDHAAHPHTLYATVSNPDVTKCDGAVFVTNDSGATWTQSRQFTQTPSRTVMRIGLGVGLNNNLFAAVSDCSGFLPTQGSFGKVVYGSGDGGASWGQLAVPSGSVAFGDWFSTGHEVGQGDYDNVVAIDPVDTLVCCFVVFGGESLAAYDNSSFGGWQNALFGIHPDIHAVAFTGDGGTLYVGSDGGVWSLPVHAAPLPEPFPPPSPSPFHGEKLDSPSNLNSGLRAIQFYRGDATDLGHVVGGAQDNGNIGNLTGTWNGYTPGEDGSYVSLTSQHIYWETESQPHRLDWTPSGSSAPTNDKLLCGLDTCINGSPGRFIDTPSGMVSDPSANTSLLIATDHLIGMPTNGAAAAPSAYSPTLNNSGTKSDCFIFSLSPFFPLTNRDCFTALAAHASSNTGGVALGTDLGQVWVHSGAFPTGWVQHPAGQAQPCSVNCAGLPAPTFGNGGTKIDQIPWVTGVGISFTDPNELWATIGTPSGPRIWHSTAALSNTPGWTSLDTASLPAGLIVTGIAVDPGNQSVVYISTSKGVFECLTCGGANPQPNWQQLGAGLPNVWVWSVSVAQDRSAIVAWTFGRGVWEIARAPGGGGAG
jgi:hypothetical protein